MDLRKSVRHIGEKYHLYRITPSLCMTVGSGSDSGRIRKNNEDHIAVCSAPISALGHLFLLADGAGGHAAGEIASQVAVETVADAYYRPLVPSHDAPSRDLEQCNVTCLHGRLEDEEEVLAHIYHAFLTAHRRIQTLAQERPAYDGMITTCLAAVVKEDHFFIAHVGDSRAYLLSPSQYSSSQPTVTRLTTDHSMSTELENQGIISAEEASQSASRHLLTRALGDQQASSPQPDLLTGVVQPGVALLLCCDGLWDMVSEAQMAQVVFSSPPQEACAELIRLANEAGGPDNISLIVIAFSR